MSQLSVRGFHLPDVSMCILLKLTHVYEIYIKNLCIVTYSQSVSIIIEGFLFLFCFWFFWGGVVDVLEYGKIITRLNRNMPHKFWIGLSH